jgi:hypothetical protein
VVEGNRCRTCERISEYVTIARDASSGNHMVREPLAAVRSEIVITDPFPARRRVNESSISRIYRDVAYSAALLE